MAGRLPPAVAPARGEAEVTLLRSFLAILLHGLEKGRLGLLLYPPEFNMNPNVLLILVWALLRRSQVLET